MRVLVHSDRRALDGLAVEVHEGDISDPAAVARLVANRDLVIHLAAVHAMRHDELVRYATQSFM
ncbi:MAG: hypothetical protein ABI467_18120 [Kofleriaceae bacterium]